MMRRVVPEQVVFLGCQAVELVGGKAAGLARLLAAGLPVPPGFVITTEAFAQRRIPDLSDLPLPGPWAVRSSATIEDQEAGAAPGLFVSRIGVEPGAAAAAVREVWASVDGPAVRAYLEALAIAPRCVAMAVIIQKAIAPSGARGTLYSRLPNQPSAPMMLVEQGDTWQQLPRDDASPLAELARAAEAALGCDAVDLEWAEDADGLWVVQARPIPQPRQLRPTVAHEHFAFTLAVPGQVWRWDAAHNPDPLSPAQVGLVERVGAGAMHVVEGYLYVADRATAGRPAIAPATLVAHMERALAPVERDLSPTIDDALTAYAQVHQLHGQLAPALRSARRELLAMLAGRVDDVDRVVHELLGEPSDARLERLVAQVAAGELSRAELFAIAGPFAPAWDVAVPTFAECPQAIDAALAAARPAAAADRARQWAQTLRAELGPSFAEALLAARRAADLAEIDDRLFARAQAAVRRALLAAADGDDDIFYVPLAEAGRRPIDRDGAQRARAEMRRQRTLAMPLAVADGHPLPDRPRNLGRVLRGRGSGGRARGQVVCLSALADAPVALPAGSVLVVATVTPAMTFLLHSARAVISEHGGLLDHGAAIARELAVPIVVGCQNALSELSSTDHVWVDGDAGLVIRLSKAPPQSR
jgi:phosphohistidine swiveling domain-containing protein